MRTFVRLLIPLISAFVMMLGIFVLVLGANDSRAASPVVIFGGSFALLALALPPAIVGSFVSYWSWDRSAHRRLRTGLIVLAAVQLAGIVGLIALAVTFPALTVGVVALIVVALAEYPIAIGLGRAVRRSELAAVPDPGRATTTSAAAGVLVKIRRGWRRIAIGGAIGLALGLAAEIAILLIRQDPARVLGTINLILAFAFIGGAFGGISSTLGLAADVRDLMGGELDTARRIGRAVNGKPDALSPEETERAVQYASIAPRLVNLRIAASGSSMLGSAALVVGQSFQSTDFSSARWFVIGLMIVAVLIVVPLRALQMRRIRAFLAAHPVSTAP